MIDYLDKTEFYIEYSCSTALTFLVRRRIDTIHRESLCFESMSFENNFLSVQ